MTSIAHRLDAAGIADALASHRWLAIGNWLDVELQQQLLDEVRQRAQDGQLAPARIGRADSLQRASDIRGDRIHWLEHSDDAECVRTLLQRLEDLRCGLNEQLFLGLAEIEAHFAHYPPGAGYARHLDRFRSDDARTLSAVIHLGESWEREHGGELQLYVDGPDGETCIDLPPAPGQLVLFLSGEIEHQVLPTRRDRYSIACWMRQRPTI